LGEGEEVDREVSSPILNIEENEQQDNLHEVNRELGNPLDTSSPEGNRNCINYVHVATCKLDKKNILIMTIKHHMSL
jgi:hypothetical protein